MKRASFEGPYGLEEIERWMDADKGDNVTAPLRVERSGGHAGRYVIGVKTDAGVVLDAYKVGSENMQEALQWMADLAGAMTGMEVEVPIYKE